MYKGKIKVRGIVIGEVKLSSELIYSGDPCKDCQYRNTWICKRFFTREDILPFLQNRKLVAVQFVDHNELINWSWYWMDRLYRMYGWDTIPIASFHCDICGNPDKYCGERFCKWRVINTFDKPTPKAGYKKFWWCSKYFFIRLPEKWQKLNVMVYLVRDTRPYEWLGSIKDQVKKEEVEFTSSRR